MKRFIKDFLAMLNYYLYRIKKWNIRVYSIDETIDELIRTNKSMVRFGDGEIMMICGKSLKLQSANYQLQEDLKRILGYQYDDMIVALQDIFGDLSVYRKESKRFWREHLLFYGNIYKKYCNLNRVYYNSLFSRLYITLDNHDHVESRISKIREIWKDKDVVVVEGARTHNGVGNDLLSTAQSVERIIGPSSHAYERLDDIVKACMKYPKDRLFLLSLGIAAKPLTETLFLAGYRVLDIGNLDMEYEWYLRGATEKVELDKHNVVGIEMNRTAGYTTYLEQIREMIE